MICNRLLVTKVCHSIDYESNNISLVWVCGILGCATFGMHKILQQLFFWHWFVWFHQHLVFVWKFVNANYCFQVRSSICRLSAYRMIVKWKGLMQVYTRQVKACRRQFFMHKNHHALHNAVQLQTMLDDAKSLWEQI